MSSPPAPEHSPTKPRTRRARTVAACALIFLAAVGVRALHWQDTRQAIPFHGMTGEYKAHAMMLVRGDFAGFLRGPDAPSDANVVKHPPGYPLLMAVVYALVGDSDTGLQFVHIALDALSALLVFLLARELFSFAVATLAGTLVALSPQLAYHSIALLPDPLATPPLLLAAYFLVRAYKRGRLSPVVAAGALVGVSCLMRSNALLLPPFIAALVPFLFERGKRLRYASALVGAALLIMLPVTVRNYVAFRSFIPLSLSAGITLVEGIGIYDTENRFGLPSSDIGVTRWEARMYGRPDYLCGRFAPDGVERERRRVAHALKVVRENPLWFLGVMARRASTMLRLARVETVAAEPAVTRPLEAANARPPAWSLTPEELYASVGPAATGLSLVPVGSPEGKVEDVPIDCGAQVSPMQYTSALWDSSVETGGVALRFAGEASTVLFASAPLHVSKDTDYLLRLPLRIGEGSLVVEIVDTRRGRLLASTPIHHSVKWAELAPDEQPFITIERPFVSYDTDQVRVVMRNGYRKPAHIVADVGRVEAFELGPSSHTWTHYPRAFLSIVQKLFLTALMLPLAFLGAALLIISRQGRALAVLLVVPAYYLCVQSALWTEFRYTLPMYYFLFILSAIGICWAGERLRRAARAFTSRAKAKDVA